MASERVFDRFYPELGIQNIGRPGAVAFYDWVRQVADSSTIMLNLGAGGPAPRAPVRVLKGEVARVVGADIDSDVLKNPEVDEAHIIPPDGTLPFPDNSFDLVLSDWVVEHVRDPVAFLTEVRRVLRVGGSFFFRTPNRRHYVGIIASVTPHWFHEIVANWARGLKSDAHEPWPTYYRLNTRSDIRAAATEAGFRSVEVRMWEGPPGYMVFNSLALMLGIAYERTVNRLEALEPLRANIFARAIK